MKEGYIMISRRISAALALMLLLTGCGKTDSADDTPAPAENSITLSEGTVGNETPPEETTTSAPEETEPTTETSSSPDDEETTTEDTSSAPSQEETSAARGYTAGSGESLSPAKSSGQSSAGSSAPASQGNSELSAFTNALPGVTVTKNNDIIYQEGIVNGQNYTLQIDISGSDGYTTTEDMVVLSRLFWQCYPAMYQRFGGISYPDPNVTLLIEDSGYEVACTWGNTIHLHDMWLYNNPGDYDCITHELAHVIQNGWDENYLEFSGYIETFADCCRYEYALDNGKYNNAVWSTLPVYDQPSRESSVRFLIWLDQNYTDWNADILRNFFSVCYNQGYPSYAWDAAWEQIFSGTALEGYDIYTVWNMYASSDFAYS